MTKLTCSVGFLSLDLPFLPEQTSYLKIAKRTVHRGLYHQDREVDNMCNKVLAVPDGCLQSIVATFQATAPSIVVCNI